MYRITYDCSNKDAYKKGLSLFRLPNDHNLRLTWFKKLRLVDPPNTDNVCVCSEHITEECSEHITEECSEHITEECSEHITEECFIVDNASCYGVHGDNKQARRKMLCQLYCLSIGWLSQKCFLRYEQNVLKRTMLVAYHTDSLLIINI